MAEIEVQSSLKQLVCNSLLLLGYSSESGKDQRPTIDGDSFNKSNTKSLECVLYFLFGKLTPQSLNVFVFCWPPRTADMKREFKEESYKLLQRLEQEGRIPENSVLGKSVLDSAQGDRVWALLKVLTDASLKQEVSVPHFPRLAPWMQNPSNAVRSSVYRMKKAFVKHISNYAQDFNGKAAKLQGVKETWIFHAKGLSEEHAKLRSEYDELVNARKKVDSHLAMQEKLAALDRIPQIDMLRFIWKNIESLHQESQSSQDIHKVTQGASSDQKITGKVQENLETWSSKLLNFKSAVEKDSKFGISLFSGQLREILNKYKARQKAELSKLLEAKKYLQEVLNTNC